MPLKLACPGCGAALAVADELLGKRVRCKKCSNIFVAEENPPVEERLQERPRPVAPAAAPRLQSAPPPVPHNAFHDSPPRFQQTSSLPLGWILSGAAALLLLLGGVVVGMVWYFAARSEAKAQQEQAAAQPQGLPPAQGGNNVMVAPIPPPPQGPPPPLLRYRWQGASPLVYNVRIEADHENYKEVHEGNVTVTANKIVRQRPVDPDERKGSGTGFVVNADGYVATCAHVVAAADKVEVVLAGQVHVAEVLIVDAERDLALLKIPARNLATVALANSDAAELGQEVRGLGFPLTRDLGENLKATRGTLSGINNQDNRKVFQTDATINGGNSGGPLVTETGEVLGVNFAKLVGKEVSGTGFAVPSNEIKTLLAAKGVTFEVRLGGAKLDGPSLVKRVAPAVALIKVTLGERADVDVYSLKCSGRLMERKIPHAGIILRPGPPTFGPGGNSSQIEMDARGHILQADGGNQMPFLLGDVGMYLIEPLPADSRASWEASGSWTITEGNGGFPGRPFGMPGPRRPFGPAAGKTFKAEDHTRLSRNPAGGETVTLTKRYELHADNGLTIQGTGHITFDLKNGLPRSSDYNATLTTADGAAKRSQDFLVTYKLLEGADRDKVLNPPPPPKVEAKPITDDEVTQLLADVKGADNIRRRTALDRMAAAAPIDQRRGEVTRAAEPFLDDKDLFTRRSCIKALGVWGDKDVVPALVKQVGDQDVFVRWEAMTALGKLQDERAAEPVAARLPVAQDRSNAAKLLIGLGAKAEKAVIPYLKNDDWPTRLETCKILKEIGTKASKAALDAASRDSNGLVAMEAKKAAEAAAARQ